MLLFVIDPSDMWTLPFTPSGLMMAPPIWWWATSRCLIVRSLICFDVIFAAA